MNLSLFTQYQVPQTPKAMTLHKLKPQFASELNREWHSRLPIIHWSNIVRNRNYICYGACYDWQYFGVGIWSSPVNQNFDFDTVLMVKAIREDVPGITRLISYQDTEVHRGTIYKAANWFPATQTKFQPWDKSRSRNGSQSTANKIRWEYFL